MQKKRVDPGRYPGPGSVLQEILYGYCLFFAAMTTTATILTPPASISS